jgi:hypothetical protein
MELGRLGVWSVGIRQVAEAAPAAAAAELERLGYGTIWYSAGSGTRGYLKLPNYVNSWLRSGYQPDDVAAGGSDRLVDDLVAWGDAAAVGDRIRAHYAAGADHVCVQVLGGAAPVPVPEWRAIAQEVLTA